MIDYEAATKYAVKFFQGDRASEREIPPHIAAGVRKIIDAALGDEPLYEKHPCDGDHFIPEHARCLEPTWVQVWPEVSDDR